MNAFAALGLTAPVTGLLKNMGIKMPTPIQMACIPAAFKGKDIIGQAQTGTGKTFAYLLPVLQRVDTEKDCTQVLIMAPTRELSDQIFQVARPFAQELSVDAADIIGGKTIENQLQKLKRDPHVIIGTPGRLLDHIRRKSLDLSNVRTVILDEADQMLANGFREDIEALIDETPKKRQMLLFSATMPDEAKRLARKYMTHPAVVNVAEKTFAMLRDKAANGESFLIIGRCSDQVLKGNPNMLSIFICGNQQAKVGRVMEKKGLSAEDAIEEIKEVDRSRKSYHNYYCETKWGDARGYDMTVKSDVLGFEGTAKMLIAYIRSFMEQG